ncbi:Carboxypeptidase A1 precursor [hydrothermal vent metagenome]|uniref:Carboxypeptidase A1 n=1 Tax=hydrothermal vent metagenome TaxID=652676 RepID=A0A1W1EHK9_9ZZZZ
MKKQYKSYQESLDFVYDMQKEYPNLIDVIKIGTTYENRDIILVKISQDVKSADNKPAMLYTGSIHAREWIGNELALDFIEFIAENQNIDPILERSLENSTIYMVPCLNPDGYEYSRKHFSFWRKNRRPNSDGSIGVDLNRNFSIGFHKESNKSSNVYGGEFPFSEAETKAIKDFVDTHPNITISFDYHSQGNVFFPAHKFKHEAELNGTDMNVICANMNDEIEKITGRKYGIHRGKPPAKLISGSGREYYYSKGIIATVVEVGTKNIPDYMKSMSSSIQENIPALIGAFSEVINYSTKAPTRVQNFTIGDSQASTITLNWDYEERDDIYFEIYRSTEDKDACNCRTKIATVGNREFTDNNLDSSTNYFYNIRAINKKSKLKSPFAPTLRVRTKLEDNEFSKIIFATKDETGYLGENTKEQNRSHFGNNSLFAGINNSRGICNSVISFNLDTIPSNVKIKSAKLYLYPMNRVGAKIERYGEWNISILDKNSFGEITDFNDIENAKTTATVGDAIKSQNLTQGIWNFWNFSSYECEVFAKEIDNGKVHFRLDGPKSLPDGEDSQIMQFDIGYGKFGGGIHYRPMLDIKYTISDIEITLTPTKVLNISKDGITPTLKSGFDKNGDRVYGYMEFDLDSMPDYNSNIITHAILKLKNKNRFKKSKDTRYYVELIEVDELNSYSDIINREKIEYIGYEVAENSLKSKDYNYFIFDTLSKEKLSQIHQNSNKLQLVIKATSPETNIKDRVLNWDDEVRLKIKYIHRRREPLAKVENVKISRVNGQIKLSWDSLDDENLKGYYVVRNSFHPPKSFSDGVKIYGGKDRYTYDNYGSFDKNKYYSIFTYDDVPNYSQPTVVYYDSLEVY